MTLEVFIITQKTIKEKKKKDKIVIEG